jgi:hypothetical protein
VLETISQKIKNDTLWVVYGSTGELLQGNTSVQPNDVDIVTTPEGLKLFSERLHKYITDNNRCGANWKGIDLCIDRVKVEVIYTFSYPDYTSIVKESSNVVLVKINGKQIPCLKSDMSLMVRFQKKNAKPGYQEFTISSSGSMKSG